MAGTPQLIKDPTFNVYETTLRDFIDMYVSEKKLADPEKYASDFKKLKGLEEFLDQPVAEIFSQAKEGNNVYAKFYDATMQRLKEEGLEGDKLEKRAGSAIRHVKSKFQVLQNNYEANLAKQMLVTDVDIVKARITPKKQAERGASTFINPNKAGELQFKLMKHARDFPEDSGKVRLALTALHTGYRPIELGALEIRDLTNVKGAASSGIFIDAGRTKAGSMMNIPIGPRTYALLQQQLEALKNQGVELTSRTKLFQVNEADAVINKLLKKISVPGIRGSYANLDKPINHITSYDFRRMYATASEMLGFSEEQAGKAIGRTTGKSAQSKYVAPPPGIFKEQQTLVSRTVDSYYFNQLAPFFKGQIPKGMVLDPNSDLIKVAQQNAKFRAIDADASVVITEHVNPSTVAYQTSPIKDDVASGEPTKSKEIKGYKDIPEYLKSVVTPKVLKTAGVIFPPAGAIYVGTSTFKEAKAEGMGVLPAVAKATAIGATEFLPVSYTDVKDTVGFIDRNKEYYEQQREAVRRESRLSLPKNQPEYGAGETTSYDETFLTQPN